MYCGRKKEELLWWRWPRGSDRSASVHWWCGLWFVLWSCHANDHWLLPLRWFHSVSQRVSRTASFLATPGKFCYPASVSTIVHPPANGWKWWTATTTTLGPDWLADQCDLPVHLWLQRKRCCLGLGNRRLANFTLYLHLRRVHKEFNEFCRLFLQRLFSIHTHKHLRFLTSEKSWWQGR